MSKGEGGIDGERKTPRFSFSFGVQWPSGARAKIESPKGGGDSYDDLLEFLVATKLLPQSKVRDARAVVRARLRARS